MKRSSREFRNHPVRAILARASSGFAPPDETELDELHIPGDVRDKLRGVASQLYDTARVGGMRNKAVARQLAEDHAADLIDSIPQSSRHSIRHEPTDDAFTATDAAAAADRIRAGGAHPARSESVDQRIARRGRSTLDRLGS